MSEKRFSDGLPTAESVAALGPRWQLYKDLVAGVPDDAVVSDVCVTAHWLYVEASCGTGMSMLVRGGRAGCRLYDDVAGMKLRDLAALSVSWSFLEASLGVAALNAWYSSVPVVEANGVVYEREGDDIFQLYREFMEGKKVAVVGHFPGIERMGEFCDLTVLERDPHGDDMPDPGCEYIVPEQDYLYVTGIALTNKTLPRLLSLAREGDVPVIMVGPSVVPSPLFYDYGVVCMAGSVCPPECAEAVERGMRRCAGMHPSECGARMMHVEKPGWPESEIAV